MLSACSQDEPGRVASTTTTTAAAEADGAPVVVAAGDIVCRPGLSPVPGQCQQEATAQTVESLKPDAVLALGDLQYEFGERANFDAAYEPTWGRFKDITRPAPGNHEWSTRNLAGYRSYWGRTETWYSFDVGDWHIISLDSNCRSVGGCQPGSPQEQWLRADLAAHPSKCVLAFWHHPRWSSGLHGSDPGYDHLWAALSEAGADVVLGGHDHHYERFDPDRGIRQFVVGTGGRSLYPTVGAEDRSVVRNSNTFGVLALTLRESSYSWRFVPSVGTFTDEGSARC